MTDIHQPQTTTLPIGGDAPPPAPENRGKRPYTRRNTREAARGASARDLLSAPGQYKGRNGEVLTRNATLNSDPFEIPEGLKEPGWSYQWITEAVINSPQVVRRHLHQMYQVGWRPVHAEGRWNGVYASPEEKGHIIVGDCGLYERPLEMSRDAQDEDDRRAVQQMRDRDQSLMGGKANVRGSMGNGIEMGGKYRGTGGNLRMSIDPGLDIPAPAHELADDAG